MRIKLKLKEAAEKRDILTQTQLLELIREKTGINMRPSTLSAMYRNNQTTVNREHLATVMYALDITNFDEIFELTEE